jgi:hypothetical protein
MKRRTPLRAWLIAAALASLIPQTSGAQPEGESLVANVPPGYKVDAEKRDGNIVTREMVPKGESGKDWTEMFSTHVFVGMKNMSPDQFKEALRDRWFEACKDAHASAVAGGKENGYPFAVWVLRCPHNASTGKPEITWFKAIEGNDNFYLVQKAFTAEPSEKQVERWMMILRRVAVCDTRLADQPCPKPGQ